MHEIDVPSELRTDLLVEQELSFQETKSEKSKGIEVEEDSFSKNKCTTIFFDDITDQANYQAVQKIFCKELKKYLCLSEQDRILVVGLGNEKSTPDSLGPATIEHILVTRYLFLLGDVEDGYSNVASFTPNVMGNTGIETIEIIQSIVQQTKATKLIIIDALKTNSLSRLGKTIQITDKGISPGSGIGNNRKEISEGNIKAKVIAIGVPTVVDLRTIFKESLKEDDNSTNFVVTPTNIDFLIEKLALLIGNGINISLHKNFIRQNNL